jgi:hypothetical protein
LTGESKKRDSIAIVLKTTPQQEAAMIAAMNAKEGTTYGLFSNNCATANVNALRKGGVKIPFLAGPSFLPTSLRDIGWAQSDMKSIVINKGDEVPRLISQFDPAP